MSALDDTVAVFQKWLELPDATALYATLGTIAANRLKGDPVWLLLVGAPSSGKSEILQAAGSLEGVYPTASLTEAGLLSGSPKRERAKGATGGLLRKVGEHGTSSRRTSAASCRCTPKPAARCWLRCERYSTAPGLATSGPMAGRRCIGKASAG